MFYIGQTAYFVFEIVTLLFFVFLLTKKQFILKHYRIFWLLFLVVSLTPEIIDYLDSLANGDYLRIVPLGMCHVAVYVTTFLMFKYNRKLHIIAVTLAAGGALSVIMPAPLDGASLSTMGPYHFYVTHIYLIAANILLAYKYNFKMSFNDYVYGISWTMALCTFLIVVSVFTKRDELFFFSGPDGLFTEDVPFGLTRAILAYIIYFTLYSMPYVVHRAYLALKSYSVLTNNQA